MVNNHSIVRHMMNDERDKQNKLAELERRLQANWNELDELRAEVAELRKLVWAAAQLNGGQLIVAQELVNTYQGQKLDLFRMGGNYVAEEHNNNPVDFSI